MTLFMHQRRLIAKTQGQSLVDSGLNLLFLLLRMTASP